MFASSALVVPLVLQYGSIGMGLVHVFQVQNLYNTKTVHNGNLKRKKPSICSQNPRAVADTRHPRACDSSSLCHMDQLHHDPARLGHPLASTGPRFFYKSFPCRLKNNLYTKVFPVVTTLGLKAGYGLGAVAAIFVVMWNKMSGSVARTRHTKEQ